jgi:hypothetical protein
MLVPLRRFQCDGTSTPGFKLAFERRAQKRHLRTSQYRVSHSRYGQFNEWRAAAQDNAVTAASTDNVRFGIYDGTFLAPGTRRP